MKRKMKNLLTVEEIAAFKEVVRMTLALDKRHEELQDYEAGTAMLNQLYNAVSPEEFDHFFDIMEMAGDLDHRSPK